MKDCQGVLVEVGDKIAHAQNGFASRVELTVGTVTSITKRGSIRYAFFSEPNSSNCRERTARLGSRVIVIQKGASNGKA